MGIVFNPFTGTFDITGEGGAAFDVDTILSGPTDALYAGPVAPLQVLFDNFGNVLVGA